MRPRPGSPRPGATWRRRSCSPGGFPAPACFHAQRSAGKALEAILYAAGERPVLGHALAELGRSVAGHDPAYAELHGEVAKLDRYHIATRYPNGLPEGAEPDAAFDEGDARSAISIASRALVFAGRFLDERSAEGGSSGRSDRTPAE